MITGYLLIAYIVGFILGLIVAIIVPSLSNHSKTFWFILTVLFLLSPIVLPLLIITSVVNYLNKPL